MEDTGGKLHVRINRPDGQQDEGRASWTSGLRVTCLQTRAGGESFKTCKIFQGIHPEKPVLKVLIRIGGRRSSDEIQNLDCVRLGHRLHSIVKLGLAASDTFNANCDLD